MCFLPLLRQCHSHKVCVDCLCRHLKTKSKSWHGQDPEAWKVLSTQDMLHRHLLPLKVDKDNCLLQGSFFPHTHEELGISSSVSFAVPSLYVWNTVKVRCGWTVYISLVFYIDIGDKVSHGSLLMVLFKLTQKAATGTPKEFDQLLKIVYILSDKYQMFMWVTHTEGNIQRFERMHLMFGSMCPHSCLHTPLPPPFMLNRSYRTQIWNHSHLLIKNKQLGNNDILSKSENGEWRRADWVLRKQVT